MLMKQWEKCAENAIFKMEGHKWLKIIRNRNQISDWAKSPVNIGPEVFLLKIIEDEMFKTTSHWNMYDKLINSIGTKLHNHKFCSC